jgi:hypothetical protein
MKKSLQSKLFAVLTVVSASLALHAFAGNDDVKVSGSSGITDTKTGAVETTGSSAVTSGTSNGVSGNVGEGTKHGTDTGAGK